MNKKNTTKEIWKPIPGWEGLYSASDKGRIRSENRTLVWRGKKRFFKGRILKTPTDNKGYCQFALCRNNTKKHTFVHQMVMLSFKGPPPKNMEVMHLDGDSTNNILSNLEYGTRRRNLSDAKIHGTFCINEMNKTAKLTKKQAIEIVKSEETSTNLSIKYGVSKSTIQHVRIGVVWENVTRPYRKAKTRSIADSCGNAKLNPEQVLKIFYSEELNVTLAKMYNVKSSTISAIKNGRRWKTITRP